MFISKPRKKVFMNCEVNPKAKALRHFQVETVYRNLGFPLTQSSDISIICTRHSIFKGCHHTKIQTSEKTMINFKFFIFNFLISI